MTQDSQRSIYGVFIIESMDSINERDGKLDGYTLKTILDLSGIPNDYYYIRTKLELINVMEEFEASHYRFLHLSCHGNKNEIALTYETIKFTELDSILGSYLFHRRLFLSVCEVAVFELAKYLIPQHHCFSVIGTPDEIEYDKAAIFWSSFYYLMYSKDQKEMFQVNILPTLKGISKLFNVNLNYFSIINDNHNLSLDHLNEIYISEGISTDKLRKTPFKNQYRDPNSLLGTVSNTPVS